MEGRRKIMLALTNQDHDVRTIQVESPIPPDALAHLAASCLFDRIELHDEESGVHTYLDGASLVREAMKVKGK